MLSQPIAVFSKAAIKNHDWLADEFFEIAPTRVALVSLAVHYDDVAAHNTVADDEYRAEMVKRAKYLRRMAAGLRNARPMRRAA